MAEAVIELVRRLPSPPPGAEEPTGLQLPLTAEQRTVLRGRRRTLCGRDVLLQLPRDGALQPGSSASDCRNLAREQLRCAAMRLAR